MRNYQAHCKGKHRLWLGSTGEGGVGVLIQHLITVYDPVAEELPPAHWAVLTPEDLEAIRKGPVFFHELARKARFDWLQRFLERCGESRGWHLEFFATDNNPYTPYFRFYWHAHPGICLPRNVAKPAGIPPVLGHFYSLLGSVKESDFKCAAGIFQADQLQSVADMGIDVSENNSVDPEQAVAFLATFNGHQLCYLPDGRGAWLENGHFKIVPSLEAELAKYFKGMLRGVRI